jgi:hypothetical protein
MIIIHRDIPGEHDTESDDCWCDPLKIDEDELKEVADEKVRIHELKN